MILGGVRILPATSLIPDAEVLVARDGRDVADLLGALTADRARQIGEAARARILREHACIRRAVGVDALLRQLTTS